MQVLKIPERLRAYSKDIILETREKRHTFHTQLESWIRTCDVFVANTSFPSISVGYEISMALYVNKPVLILHHLSTSPPNLLADYKNDKVVCEAYTYQSLPKTIADFVNFSKSKAQSRFTFFNT